ncbi:hypothetical protein FOCC_FOCC005233 [Frankliniella occidentalis]|nr:hypothetical protein FOCC_FOCC005233 [Frankliniella occidentalis]
MTTMSSGEGDDSEYDDIKVFFTSSEWKELTSEEKRCHRKSKDNYEAIRRCGWTTRPPFFMCRKPPAPARQHPPETQDETAGEGAALPSKLLPSLLDQAEEQGHPPGPSPDQPREVIRIWRIRYVN